MSQEARPRNEEAKTDELHHFSGVTDPNFAQEITGSNSQCSITDTASSFLTSDIVNPVSSIRESGMTVSDAEPPTASGKSSESIFAQFPSFPLQTLVFRKPAAEDSLMQATPGIMETAEFNVGRTEETSVPAVLLTRPRAHNLSLKPQLETTDAGYIQGSREQLPGLQQTEVSFTASPGLKRDGVSEKLTPSRAVGTGDAPPARIGPDSRSVLPDNVVRIISRHVDVPHVRLHSDAAANFMASKLNAEAFTLGHDVFFASRKLDLSTPSGVALLGHELTHVRQQQELQASPSDTGRMEALRRSTLENEAMINERAILSSLHAESQPFVPSQINSSPVAKRTEAPGLRQVELTHIGIPQVQRIVTEGRSNILKAEPGRELGASAPLESTEILSTEPTSPEPDINHIAQQVYEIIEDRIRREKERRGYF